MKIIWCFIGICLLNVICLAKEDFISKEEKFQFLLYKHTLLLNNNKIERILKEHVGNFNSEELINKGYKLEAPNILRIVELNKKGFLEIYKDRVNYDEIKSFVVKESESSKNKYIYFDTNQNSNNEECITIVDVDKNFSSEHKIKSNTIVEFDDSKLVKGILENIEKYTKEKSYVKELFYEIVNLDFKNEKNKISFSEVIGKFDIKLLKIKDIPIKDFYIAKFIFGKNGEQSLACFVANEEITAVGIHHDYISFSIDKNWYIGFSNSLKVDSGFVGKELYKYEDKKFKLIQEDYRFEN